MTAETAPGAGASVLAIDAGNTRIKWGVHDGARWLTQQWIATARVAQFKAALASMRVPRSIVISNVAGVALRKQIQRALPATPAARWIESARAQCGVRSSYADPAQLGCDRWAALIGARCLFGVAAVVVNAGTALTVDALTGDGVFAAVGKRHDPAAGIRRDFPALGLGLGLFHGLREIHRLHVLRAAAAALVHEGQLLAGHLDLVPVEQGSGLSTEANAVDQHVRFWNGLGDHDLPVRKALQLGMTRQNAGGGQRNRAARI